MRGPIMVEKMFQDPSIKKVVCHTIILGARIAPASFKPFTTLPAEDSIILWWTLQSGRYRCP